MSNGLGILANASTVRDSETGAEYVLHGDCREAFDALMDEHGVGWRFVGMGPAILNEGACHWSKCEAASVIPWGRPKPESKPEPAPMSDREKRYHESNQWGR